MDNQQVIGEEGEETFIPLKDPNAVASFNEASFNAFAPKKCEGCTICEEDIRQMVRDVHLHGNCAACKDKLRLEQRDSTCPWRLTQLGYVENQMKYMQSRHPGGIPNKEVSAIARTRLKKGEPVVVASKALIGRVDIDDGMRQIMRNVASTVKGSRDLVEYDHVHRSLAKFVCQLLDAIESAEKDYGTKE
jgi:hypothetical protein